MVLWKYCWKPFFNFSYLNVLQKNLPEAAFKGHAGSLCILSKSGLIQSWILPPDHLPAFLFSNSGDVIRAEGRGSVKKTVSMVFLWWPTHPTHCLTQFSEENAHPSVRHALIKRSQEHRAMLHAEIAALPLLNKSAQGLLDPVTPYSYCSRAAVGAESPGKLLAMRSLLSTSKPMQCWQHLIPLHIAGVCVGGFPLNKTIAWLQQRGELPDSFPVSKLSHHFLGLF